VEMEVDLVCCFCVLVWSLFVVFCDLAPLGVVASDLLTLSSVFRESINFRLCYM
jgi:hypothetical protein